MCRENEALLELNARTRKLFSAISIAAFDLRRLSYRQIKMLPYIRVTKQAGFFVSVVNAMLIHNLILTISFRKRSAYCLCCSWFIAVSAYNKK